MYEHPLSEIVYSMIEINQHSPAHIIRWDHQWSLYMPRLKHVNYAKDTSDEHILQLPRRYMFAEYGFSDPGSLDRIVEKQKCAFYLEPTNLWHWYKVYVNQT